MPPIVATLSADEVLQQSMRWIAGSRCTRAKEETQIERFVSHFGSTPAVIAALWQELRTSGIKKARIGDNIALQYLFMACYWLKSYDNWEVTASKFDVCDRTARDWTWWMIKKIAALKEAKIVWPESFDTIFTVSVDGTHCPIQEPYDPIKPRDTTYFSVKHGGVGLNYEVAIDIFEHRCVWMKGPYKASVHDMKIFKKKGLKDQIPAGKKVIGDNGYKGKELAHMISYPNSFDDYEVRKFKSRARCRHESFNSRLKNYGVLVERFRHPIHKHKAVFEAVLVICQLQLENGNPLFDV